MHGLCAVSPVSRMDFGCTFHNISLRLYPVILQFDYLHSQGLEIDKLSQPWLGMSFSEITSGTAKQDDVGDGFCFLCGLQQQFGKVHFVLGAAFS